MAKMVLLQVLRGWNHDGITLQVGARIKMSAAAARGPIRRGYARIVKPDEAFDYPADDPKHKFQEIEIDEPPIKKDAKVELHQKEFEGATSADPGELPAKITIPAIGELDFLKPNQVEALNKKGLYAIQDLKKWNADKLMGIRFIGKATAEKLMDAYNQYVNIDHHKDSDLEINEK